MDLQGLTIRLLVHLVSNAILSFGDGDGLSLLPGRVDVWEHSDVTFHCTNQAQSLTAVRWYKNNQTAAMQSGENTCQVYGFLRNQTLFSFSCSNNITFSVTLKKIHRTRHTETWKCSDHLLHESNVVTIFVKVPAKTATVFPSRNVFSTVEHATFTPFQCISDECRPEPTFLWYKDQNTYSREDDILMLEDISSSNSTNMIQNYTSTLLFTANRSLNGWYIFCAVQNSLEGISISDKILLNITDFPKVRLVKKIITEGDNFTYSCNVSNENLEVTNVTWSWANKVWYGKQLTLNKVSRTQAGTYLCGVSNITNKSDGPHVDSKVMGNIQLNVEYNAQVLNLWANSKNATDNLTVNENDAVNISCNIEGNPLPDGEMKFLEANYIRNARTFVKINNSLKQNLTNLQLVTQLYAKCTDAGQYTCTGWNILHNGSRTESYSSIQLFIKCMPRISPFYEIHDNVFCALSSNVTLSFTALAYPDPPVSEFVWYKKDLDDNWETINSSSLDDKRSSISTSGLQSNLTINNITQLDYGLYKLMIENEVGKYEHSFNLYAISEPEDSDGDKKQVILAGATGGTFGSIVILLAIFVAVILRNLLVSYFLIAEPEDSDDDQKQVILAGATGGTFGSIVILLAIFVAVIVIRRSSKRSKAAASIEPRYIDGSQTTHNFSQVVNTNSPLNGGYPIFYEELLNAVVANYSSLECILPNLYEELPNADGGNPAVYEELLDAGKEQQNAYENIKMTRTKGAPQVIY